MADAQDQALLRTAVSQGLITDEDATLCLEAARRTGRPLTDLLAARGLDPRTVAALRTFVADAPAGAAPAPAGDGTWWSQSQAAPAPAPAPRTGQRLVGAVFGGDFEVIEPLGEGGMGVVFRARQRSLGREVALKVLAREVAGEGGAAAERFLREARTSATISHPHVVTVFAAGRDQASGRLFMAMELMRGGDAAALARRHGGRLPERRALEIARDVARGLTALGRAGLVHRDVKPDNVFLAADGAAKLADLGLARGTVDRLTETGTVVGTPAFMSPEQAEGAQGELDGGTDVYGLGATLYALLTGRPPFEADSMIGVLKKVLEAPPPDPRAEVPSVSAATAAIVRRSMAKARAHRHATADELLADLERALAGLAGAEAGGGGRRGTPRAAVGLGVAVALVGIVGAVVVGLGVRPPDAPDVATTETGDDPRPEAAATTGPPGGEVAPVSSTVLRWAAATPDAADGVEIIEGRNVAVDDPRLQWVLGVPGKSAVTAQFVVRGAPTWTHLRLGHFATNASGLTATFVDVEVNGRLLAFRAHPKECRQLDLTSVVTPGLNELRISLHAESRTVYWLRWIEVHHGRGLAPPLDEPR
ncbi:MAG: serine/threonine protein kinase [Planctomycetes bacterium]|nr:serine/threonine protein kinase [Planctomycetota bacterium]